MIERSQRSAAKIFAVTYLLIMVILMAVFRRFYAPYLVWENGEETARRFLHHEEAIRIYLVGAFLHGVGMIVLLTALYVLLRPVNRGMALCAAFSRAIYAVFWFIFILDMLGALRFWRGLARCKGLERMGWRRWPERNWMRAGMPIILAWRSMRWDRRCLPGCCFNRDTFLGFWHCGAF
jgi:hypothetical protein